MNYLKIIVAVLFLFWTTSLAAQASKRTPQIHTLPEGIVKILVEAPSNRVEILKTKGTRISIETNIRIDAGSLPLLEYLVQNGRYELEAVVDAQTHELTLRPKKNQKILLVKGAECQEIVTYKIHIPESVEFVETLDSSSDNFIAHH